eukprot:SAG11_NODE_124_length_15798_cov_14.675776_12_plen_191_part_00
MSKVHGGFGHGAARPRRPSARIPNTVAKPAPNTVAKPVAETPASEQEPVAELAMRDSDRLIAALLEGAAVREPLRPSLTKQLHQAVSGCDEVMEKFGAAGRKSGVLLDVEADHFSVFRCASRQASNVCFFADRATYKFHHPVRGPIDMLMHYVDMDKPRVDMARKEFVFHINRQLRHFLDDYQVPSAGAF